MVEGTASVTAKLCSFVRAYHSGHDRQKIFDDFLARELMGDAEYGLMHDLVQCEFAEGCPLCPCSAHDTCPSLRYYLSPILLARVAFAEEQLEAFAAGHERCQYVICGAGLDTFSLRNGDDGIRIFELDHPDTQSYKLGRIDSLGWGSMENVAYVPIDFNVDSIEQRLLDAGFDPQVPSFFALLDVTYYLDLPVFEQTCQAISNLQCEDSVLCFDFPDQSGLTSGFSERIVRLAQFTEKLGEPMSGGYQLADVASALRRVGLGIEQYCAPPVIQSRYFDGSPAGLEAYENVHFIAAAKR